MANRPPEQAQPSASNGSACAPLPGTPIFTEPEVRRWPHPIEECAFSAGLCPLEPSEPSEDALSHIHLAISHQNQLLLEIKSLLEHLTAETSQNLEEK